MQRVHHYHWQKRVPLAIQLLMYSSSSDMMSYYSLAKKKKKSFRVSTGA